MTNLYKKKNQLFFLNFLKAISITAVVSFHSIFVSSSTYINSEPLIEILFAPLRFCVPIFFTISFLLYEKSEINRPTGSLWLFIKKRYTRLFYPIIFWFGVAIILKVLKGNSWLDIFYEAIRGEIFTGSYYLLALLQLLPIFFFIRNKFTVKFNLFFALLFHFLVGIAIYLSLRGIVFNTLVNILRLINRPLFIYWLIYLVMGIYIANNLARISQISKNISIYFKVFLLFFLCFLFWKDYSILYKITNGEVAPFDYLTISSILCVPIIFCCFASIEEKHIVGWMRRTIKALSKYSLGIFCINGLLRLVFLSLGSSIFADFSFNFYEILSLKLIGWAFLLSLSFFFSILLERIGLQKFVC